MHFEYFVVKKSGSPIGSWTFSGCWILDFGASFLPSSVLRPPTSAPPSMSHPLHPWLKRNPHFYCPISTFQHFSMSVFQLFSFKHPCPSVIKNLRPHLTLPFSNSRPLAQFASKLLIFQLVSIPSSVLIRVHPWLKIRPPVSAFCFLNFCFCLAHPGTFHFFKKSSTLPLYLSHPPWQTQGKN